MMENDDIKITLANDEVNEVMGNLQTQVRKSLGITFDHLYWHSLDFKIDLF